MAKQQKKDEGLYQVEWATISIRKIQAIVFILAGIGVFLVYWYVIKKGPVKVEGPSGPVLESAARFMDYEGKVEVKGKDKFVWESASFKMDLHEGDRIKCGSDSSAKVRFDDGTEITVKSDSIVVISKGSSADSKAEAPVVVIEIGEGNINTDRTSKTPTLVTEKINSRVAPNSDADAVVDPTTGENSIQVNEGISEVTTKEGTKTIKELEKLNVDKNNAVTQVKLPYVPQLLSPTDTQLFEFLGDKLSVELKWRDVSNAAKYHIQVSETAMFAKLSGENKALAKNSLTLQIPKAKKKQYFWRVRSIDKDGNASPWSKIFQFMCQSPTDVSRIPGSDPTPPKLEITYIHPFFPFVQVEGKTEADAVLTLNGQIIDVQDDGSFNSNYTLEKTGVNDLVFVAEDPSGNKSTVTKQVTY